jgi:thiamine kinase-like enzyme
MNNTQLAHLCSTLNLGTPITVPQKIVGGRVHTVWHIQTEKDQYAIKELNTHILDSHKYSSLEKAEDIAKTFAKKDIPTTYAYKSNGTYIQTAAEKQFLVYPWIEGSILPENMITTNHIKQITSLLSNIHNCNLSFEWLKKPIWHTYQNEHYEKLLQRTLEKKLPYSDQFRKIMPELCTWNKQSQEAIPRLNTSLLASHSDIDSKNVLWKDNDTPIIIDWELAQLVNPFQELVQLILDWSDVLSCTINYDHFDSITNEYFKHHPLFTINPRDAFHGVIVVWLNWTQFNICRSLGEKITNNKDQTLGFNIAKQMINVLPYIFNHVTEWSERIEKVMIKTRMK